MHGERKEDYNNKKDRFGPACPSPPRGGGGRRQERPAWRRGPREKEVSGLHWTHFHEHRPRERVDQRTRMLETPVERLIPVLAAPTITSMMVTSIYNMADTYFVSQLSTSASGAVGVVFPVMSAIQAVGFTVGMGSGSIAARMLGQERREEADRVSSSAVLLALVLGTFWPPWASPSCPASSGCWAAPRPSTPTPWTTPSTSSWAAR